MPNHRQDTVIEGVLVSVPVGIEIVSGRVADGVHEVHIEVEKLAAVELVDHPCEGDVLDLVVGVATSYVAVVAWKPTLNQLGLDGLAGDRVHPGCIWVEPPEGGRE